jgi:hypothetical protein
MEKYDYGLSKFRTPLIRAIIIGLTSTVILEFSRTFLRPVFGKGQGFVPELLGVLPNFLAAFGIPFVVLGAYYCCMAELDRSNPNSLKSFELSKGQLTVAFLIVTLFITAGLISWEYLQMDSNLVFDYKDIVATIVGSIVSFHVFYKLH